MKKVSLYLFLFLGSLLSAQPVLTSSDFTDYFSNAYKGDAAGLGPGSAGENRIWDFGSTPYNPVVFYTVETVPVASVPFVANFPLTDFALKHSLFLESGTYDYYLPFQLSTSALDLFANTTANEITEDYTADPQRLHLPITYNSVWNDTYQSAMHSYFMISERIYDGYGTLITPFGTFQNVIRYQESTRKSTSTETSVRYNWISTNPYRQLMSANFDPADLNFGIYFYEVTPLATDGFLTDAALDIYPNPAIGILNINQDIDYLTLFDITGKRVLELRDHLGQIDVSALAPGLYLLQAQSSIKKFQQKFIKQ